MMDFKTIEVGVLYKFDIDKYLRKETVYRISNGGIKRQLAKTEITCVYEFNEDGKIKRRTRGSLVERKGFDNEFLIITSEDEEVVPFKITMPFSKDYNKEISDEIALYNQNPNEYIEENSRNIK